MNSLRIQIIVVFLTFPLCAFAEEESIPLPFSEQSLGDKVELDVGSDVKILRLSANIATQGKFHLFDIDAPAITGEAFAVVGEVRCKGLTDTGYLEMWTHLPTTKGGKEIGTSFFSRTLAPSGPMESLHDDQEWRMFQLPAFLNDGSERRPLKLTLNVFLPGQGVVELRNMRLLPSMPIPPQMGSTYLTWSWPIGGAALILAGIAVCCLIFFFRKRKTRTELSRIRNLDSV